MCQELREVFEQNQADRQSGLHPGMAERDRQRRQRLAGLMANGEIRDSDDYWHAAMLLQLGDTLEDYRQAHRLAKRGATLGHAGCRWLAAKAYDRWLVSHGKAQKLGTQGRMVNGRVELAPIDPATTDAERAEWNAKPLVGLRPNEPSNIRALASGAIRHRVSSVARSQRHGGAGRACAWHAISRFGRYNLKVRMSAGSR